MANVNLGLDEIIQSQKKKNRGGNRGDRIVGGGGSSRKTGKGARFSRNGGGRTEKYFSEDVPSGKWKHDKYNDLYGSGSKRSLGVGGGGLKRPRAARARNEIVKLIISNLPETVVTADLQELFQDFGVSGTAVHYDETGAHLGTADLYADVISAQNIIREYANIAIDGQKISIAFVDEAGALKPRIQDRIRRVASNPIRQRKTQIRRSGGGGGVRRRSGAKGSEVKLKQMSVVDLDKELEVYMSNRNAGAN